MPWVLPLRGVGGRRSPTSTSGRRCENAYVSGGDRLLGDASVRIDPHNEVKNIGMGHTHRRAHRMREQRYMDLYKSFMLCYHGIQTSWNTARLHGNLHCIFTYICLSACIACLDVGSNATSLLRTFNARPACSIGSWVRVAPRNHTD